MAALNISAAAVQLAPDLPHAHLSLAHSYFSADPFAPGRYLSEVWQALLCLWRDPRYARPVLGDFGVSLIFALLATCAAVIAALFLRTVRYLLHDFHHLFPRVTLRWQSGIFACLILLLPVACRLGLMPSLLVWLAAITAYLTAAERGVVSALVVLLAFAHLGAQWMARSTAFPGTVSEEIYRVERGGPEAAEAAEQLRKRAADQRAQFADLFALGRYELRRGDLDAAIGHFQQAAGKRNGDARVLTNLGNAMFAKGDLEGAAEAYTSATAADPSSAAAFYNLAVLYARRATGLPAAAAATEMLKKNNAIDTVQRLEPPLLSRGELTTQVLANRALISPPVSAADVWSLTDSDENDANVQSQVSLQLLGEVDPSFAWAYPIAAIALLLGPFAGLGKRWVCKGCSRCGRPVCRRCDPELSAGSVLCQQCVNVFARRNVVEAAVKIQKQIEVAHFRIRKERLGYFLSLLCSGAGHIFSGFPIRGTLYAFAFLAIMFNILFRHGVLRYPYAPEPLFLGLIPLGLAFSALYLLSLRGLYKHQS
jgi:tetratricopeptide (TPR) repeat protein